MADGGKDERKERLTRIWGIVGTIIIAADTEFLHAYTIESYIFFLLGAIAFLRALSFDFPLRLERIRSAVLQTARGRRGIRRPPRQGGVTQSTATTWPAEQTVGAYTILLPFIIIYGARIADGPVLASLSDYYYSSMRNILVGAFCGK